MSVDTDRPPRLTENLGLPVPGDADPADNPTDLGELADAIDQLAALFFTPGDLRPTGSSKPRAGWLLCDGGAYVREEYVDLFDAIGVAFGAGDGATTFNVPDLRGRAPVGAGTGAGLTNRPLGASGGEEVHALAAGEMPSHGHGVSDPTHAHGVADPGHSHDFGGWRAAVTSTDYWNPKQVSGGNQANVPYIPTTGNVSTIMGTGAAGTGIGIYGAYTGIGIQAAGGNGAHNNLPPFLALNWLIKT